MEYNRAVHVKKPFSALYWEQEDDVVPPLWQQQKRGGGGAAYGPDPNPGQVTAAAFPRLAQQATSATTTFPPRDHGKCIGPHENHPHPSSAFAARNQPFGFGDIPKPRGASTLPSYPGAKDHHQHTFNMVPHEQQHPQHLHASSSAHLSPPSPLHHRQSSRPQQQRGHPSNLQQREQQQLLARRQEPTQARSPGSAGTSSSLSSDSTTPPRTNLTADELAEFERLVRDLWSSLDFSQQIREYSHKEYLRVKLCLDEIDELRRFRRRGGHC